MKNRLYRRQLHPRHRRGECPFAGCSWLIAFMPKALNQPFHVTRIMLAGLVMNIPANGLFIYGWFGMPELGDWLRHRQQLGFIGMTLALALNTHKHRIPKGYPHLARSAPSSAESCATSLKSAFQLVAIFFEVSLLWLLRSF